MPGPLIGVTLTTPDVAGSCRAYCEYLNYRVEPTAVDADLAAALEMPELTGCRGATLFPEPGGPRFIRLVEGPADPAPLTGTGWTAVELIVRDLDRVADRLANSPFRVIGPPETLDFDFTDAIRAMQVVGPAGEVLYLTEIRGTVPGFDLPRAETDVGAPFIAVAGVTDLAGWLADARAAMNLESGPPIDARIAVLSRALGLERDTRHRLTTVSLGDATYLEIDHLPPFVAPRPPRQGLPCGIIAATIGCSATQRPTMVGELRFEWQAIHKND